MSSEQDSMTSEILDDQEYLDLQESRILDRSTSTNVNRYLDYLELLTKKLTDNPDDSELKKQKESLLKILRLELKNSSLFNREGIEASLKELESHKISYKKARQESEEWR